MKDNSKAARCGPAEWNGYTALHLAADKDVCRLLVGQRRQPEYHVDPNVQGMDGSTALHCACAGKRLGVMEYLAHLERCNCDGEGKTPLECYLGAVA